MYPTRTSTWTQPSSLMQSSNEALWWKMFKSQFEERMHSSRSSGTYNALNVLIHPQSNNIMSSDCHLAFVSEEPNFAFGKNLIEKAFSVTSVVLYFFWMIITAIWILMTMRTKRNAWNVRRISIGYINKTMSLVEARSWLPSKSNATVKSLPNKLRHNKQIERRQSLRTTVVKSQCPEQKCSYHHEEKLPSGREYTYSQSIILRIKLNSKCPAGQSLTNSSLSNA